MIMFFLAAGLLQLASPANTEPVRTAEEACRAVKVQFSARHHVPISTIAFCDVIPAARRSSEYYILALQGRRADCDGICSTNTGWFAVHKKSGRVFEWNMASDKLGHAISIEKN